MSQILPHLHRLMLVISTYMCTLDCYIPITLTPHIIGTLIGNQIEEVNKLGRDSNFRVKT